MLAKDEVSAAEFVHRALPLVMRVEFTVEGDTFSDLLFNLEICHFLFINRYHYV